MPKKKKLFLVILLALLIDDLCKYIKVFVYDKPKRILSFDFVVTRFDRGIVVNLSILYIIIISVIYFAINFFEESPYEL